MASEKSDQANKEDLMVESMERPKPREVESSEGVYK